VISMIREVLITGKLLVMRETRIRSHSGTLKQSCRSELTISLPGVSIEQRVALYFASFRD
jgi:hypothetical protein